MTKLQKVLLVIYIFLISAGQLHWFGTDPWWIGVVGMAFVIAVIVEWYLDRNTERR